MKYAVLNAMNHSASPVNVFVGRRAIRFGKKYCLSGVLALLVCGAPAQVLINEILYDPEPVTAGLEFIELHNAGGSPVDIGGWHFTEGVEYTIPTGISIPAGGYLVVAADPAAVVTRFGGSALGPWGNPSLTTDAERLTSDGYKLSNDGEQIVLHDTFGTKVDEVDYQRGFPWPTCPAGQSMELMHPTLDNNLGGSWRSAGTLVAGSRVYIPASATDWRYFEGTEEASSPVSAWRELSFSDSAWGAGQASFGYGDDDDNTILNMREQYTTLYLRKKFTIAPGEVSSSLQLRVYADDGAVVWINGIEVARINIPGGELTYDATATQPIEASWKSVLLTGADAYLVEGENVIAVQAINQALNSSDFSIDLELTEEASAGGGDLATPGSQNGVYQSNVPPFSRQVDHAPKTPVSGEPVTVTAKVTDPQSVQRVVLEYQVVEPGSYVRSVDAAYGTGWFSLDMLDDGSGSDAVSGDDIYTAVIPAIHQNHRNLIRYRMTVSDTTGQSQTVPYNDDDRRNFAYFVYDGVPEWTGADEPGETAATTFSTNVLAHALPVYHLLAQETDVINCQYNSSYGGVRFYGTLVYDGQVYDHIQFRVRGEYSTYVAGKNKWRFYFNSGDHFQARDNYGEKYKNKFRIMNFNACASPWSPVNRGMAGLDEAVSYRLQDLAGTIASKTHFTHFRIIDQAVEASPADPFEGDLWGLYLVVEHIDGNFLDERDLPDGNTYKIAGSTGDKKNQGRTQTEDTSDWNAFRDTGTTLSSTTWWREHFDLPSYYAFRGINRVTSNIDLRDGSNFGMYHHPNGRWYVLPQDLDMMFAPETHQAGTVEMKDCLAQSELLNEYRNSCRKIMDLMLSDASPTGGQAVQLIYDLSQWTHPPGAVQTFADVDQFMWNHHPRATTSHRGQFYVTPKEDTNKWGGIWTRTLTSADYEGFIQYVTDFITDTDPDEFVVGDGDQRGYGFNYLEQEAADSAIPYRPTITYTGIDGYPVDGLSFSSSAFNDPQGSNSFGAMEWRLAEVRNASSPGYMAGERWKYEMTALWESGEISTQEYTVDIPPLNLKAGHTYRVRVRHKDNTDRWSHYSEPIEFVALGISGHNALMLSEVHYNPAGPTSASSFLNDDFEFVEFLNTSTNPLSLYGYGLDGGIEFSFTEGAVAALQSGDYLLVVRNLAAFASRYATNGMHIAGEYSGKLSNGGEHVRLEYYGQKIYDIAFNDARGWPMAADGGGHSLIPINDEVTQQGYDILDYPFNWRASTYQGGSPGAADPVESTTLLMNELMAHTDTERDPPFDSNDRIELFNPTATAIVLDEHWYLSDDPGEPEKWNIPSGTTVPAGGWVVFSEDDFHPDRIAGFGLDKTGEQVLLSHRPGDATDRIVDSVAFKGQASGASWGRYPDGDPYWQTVAPTAGSANQLPEPTIRIEELMYHPPAAADLDTDAELEYIRLINHSASMLSFSGYEGIANPWRMDGGVRYTFDAGISLAAGASLWLVPFDPVLEPSKKTFFCTTYNLDAGSVQLAGPYQGELSNSGERIALERAQASDDPLAPNDISWIIVDEVIWLDEVPWPVEADGAGYSLLRIGAAGNDPLSWVSSDDSDADGLPDAWELSLRPNLTDLGAGDFDGDGLDDKAEFIAGTDPGDPLCSFRITDHGLFDPEGFIVQWTPVTGRVYSVYWSSNLTGQALLLASSLDYPTGSYTDQVYQAEPAGFYYISVTNAVLVP